MLMDGGDGRRALLPLKEVFFLQPAPFCFSYDIFLHANLRSDIRTEGKDAWSDNIIS